MRSHPTWREARLVSKPTHAHGVTGAATSRDKRVPRPVHPEEAFLKAEPGDALNAAIAIWLRAEPPVARRQ